MKQKRRSSKNRRTAPVKSDRSTRKRLSARGGRSALTAFCVALALIMLALALYVGWWYVNRGRIRADSARYAELYGGRDGALILEVTAMPTPERFETPSPTAIPADEPTASPAPTTEPTPTTTAEPTPAPTTEPTPTATLAPTVESTFTPAPTASITIAPTVEATAVATAEPTQAPTPTPAPTDYVPFGADMPVVEDVPIPTPGADTRVYALPTAPPVQPGFNSLLALNPETVGFLELDGMLSLPVVQRENDNEYYLSHSFEGEDSREGALFLDGLNRLVPEDDCLIVYGHNMKNDTMFGRLDSYEDLNYLRQHSVIHFDTLYENRSYVAFAAFTASMEAGNSRFFDVRQFIFDDVEFDKFVLKLQSRSRFKIPVDVRYGDRLLLLVTCDYTSREGRFILALRQLRADETEADLWGRVMQATAK